MSASKKGKKQDVSSSDDGFESYVRDCLQAIRQDTEEIINNQGEFKEDLQAVKKKLDRTEKPSCFMCVCLELKIWLPWKRDVTALELYNHCQVQPF